MLYDVETIISMHVQMNEHDRDKALALVQNFAVSEHSSETVHYPLWDTIIFIDHVQQWYTRTVIETFPKRFHFVFFSFIYCSKLIRGSFFSFGKR